MATNSRWQAWKEANPEKNRESQRKGCKKWREANKEKVKAYNKSYKKTNAEKVKIIAKKYEKTQREISKQWSKINRSENNKFVTEIKIKSGCCNPECCWNGAFQGCDLDFHHKDKLQKKKSIALMMGSSKEKILTEINKCTILCAICHMRVHAGTLNCSNFPLCTNQA